MPNNALPLVAGGAQPEAASARQQWRRVARGFRHRFPRLAQLVDEAEEDVLSYAAFPTERWQKVWSNIPECARYMFEGHDPEFHDRALEWGGGFVVGGHNYGQGSSREQAALSALHLGVRAVISKSFAHIHRSNLIAQGILPLTFIDEADYDKMNRGDAWKIETVREAVSSGETELVAKSDSGGEEIRLEVRLLPREREVLLAGGELKYLRERG